MTDAMQEKSLDFEKVVLFDRGPVCARRWQTGNAHFLQFKATRMKLANSESLARQPPCGFFLFYFNL